MAKTIEIYLDIAQYVAEFGDKFIQLLAAGIVNDARRYVAVSTSATRPPTKKEPNPPHGQLRNTIHQTKEEGIRKVIAGNELTPYAAAQEYGLAKYGKPNYTFTPYMRPAAASATTSDRMQMYAKDAENAARMKARRGLGK
jgi:hypothetical protein